MGGGLFNALNEEKLKPIIQVKISVEVVVYIETDESYLVQEMFISNEQVSCIYTFSVSERGSQGTPSSFVWNLNDQC